jgi:flagellar protein FliL
MATNRLDPIKPSEEALRTPAKEAPAAAASAGGFKAWIPLLANVILMPAIAYAITTFLLIPKLQGGKATSAEQPAAEAAHGAPSGGGKAAAKNKITVPLSGRVTVNVAGTAGTRYLVANLTLVGKVTEFKGEVEAHDPQLRDAASSILSGKTISDLEKPGMRNMIRAELISAFNDILGKEAVTDLYLTEFAIQ